MKWERTRSNGRQQAMWEQVGAPGFESVEFEAKTGSDRGRTEGTRHDRQPMGEKSGGSIQWRRWVAPGESSARATDEARRARRRREKTTTTGRSRRASSAGRAA